MILVDAFTEVLYFTVVNRDFDFAQFNRTQLIERYRDLIAGAETRARESGVADAQWRTALFAVVAWVDETVLLSQWPDRLPWQRESLQRTYFHTANAGVEFYRYLESLDDSESDVREIYDVCLSLGFRGALYREVDEESRRSVVAQTVAKLSTAHDLTIPGTLFPHAYRGKGDDGDQVGLRKIWIPEVLLLVVPPIVVLLTYMLLQLKLNTAVGAWISGF